LTEKRLGGNIGSQATKNTRIKMVSLFFWFLQWFFADNIFKGAYFESEKKNQNNLS